MFPSRLTRFQALHGKQRGAVLVVTLIFLMVITILAISSVQISTSEERMAGNMKDWNIAMQAAESALRDAEFDIYGVCSVNVSSCTLRSPVINGETNFGNQSASTAYGTCNQSTSYKGACMPPTPYNLPDGKPVYALPDMTNWSTASTGKNPVTYGTYTGATALPSSGISGVYQQPQYIIEAMRMPTDKGVKVLYRITARGWGRNSNTQVVLQSVFRLPD